MISRKSEDPLWHCGNFRPQFKRVRRPLGYGFAATLGLNSSECADPWALASQHILTSFQTSAPWARFPRRHYNGRRFVVLRQNHGKTRLSLGFIQNFGKYRTNLTWIYSDFWEMGFSQTRVGFTGVLGTLFQSNGLDSPAFWGLPFSQTWVGFTGILGTLFQSNVGGHI